ncbi:MAG: hypothetical protein SNJ75_15595 [Gemmataceae bacterium]
MSIVENILRILAIFGAFTGGAWLSGWSFERLAGHWFPSQKVPNWAAWTVRTLGGTCLALLVFLIAFGGGGTGIGGIGGLFSGGDQRGTKDGQTKDKNNKNHDEKDKNRTPKDPNKTSDSPTTLRVEVLGDRPLQRLLGERFDRARRYRVGGSPDLLTLDQIRDRIRQGLKADPPLGTLEVVLYNDSPTAGPVKDLIRYARDVGADRLRINEETLDKNAP